MPPFYRLQTDDCLLVPYCFGFLFPVYRSICPVILPLALPPRVHGHAHMCLPRGRSQTSICSHPLQLDGSMQAQQWKGTLGVRAFQGGGREQRSFNLQQFMSLNSELCTW